VKLFGEVASEPALQFLDTVEQENTRYEMTLRTQEELIGKGDDIMRTEVNEFRVQLSGEMLMDAEIAQGEYLVVEGLLCSTPWQDEYGGNHYCQEVIAMSIIRAKNCDVIGTRHTRASVSISGRVVNDAVVKEDAKGKEIVFATVRVQGRTRLGMIDFEQDVAVFNRLVSPARHVFTKGTWVYLDGRLHVHGVTPKGDARIQIIPLWMEALR